MQLGLFFGIIGLGVVVDHIGKYMAITYLMGQESRVLLPALLDLTYVENTGAAFGIFSEKTALLAVFTVFILAALITYTLLHERSHPLFMWSAALISGGAIGNLLDRVFRGYVVDFLEFSFFDFPVFNLADCLVVLGAALLAVQVLFLEKGE